MPVSAPNTMSELLTKILRTLTDAKLADDADPDFIDQLEQAIVGYLRAPAQDALAAQQQQGQVPPSMGGMPPGMQAPQDGGMGGPGGPGSPGGPGGPGGPGMMTVGPAAGWPPGRGSRTSPAAPNPDQLSQLLRTLPSP